jgi:phospholipid/cholesterol/gamma-HCH transport system permease protein
VKGYLQLNLAILYWLLAGPFQRRGLKLPELFQQMVRIGVEGLPMAALTAYTIGLTLAMQSAAELEKLGVANLIPAIVAKSMMREVGPLIVAVIVIGRSGSAVTAELGTMKVSEEIEALGVMAINPMHYLVLPRFLAMLVMLPVLTIFGNCIGFAGGWTICHFALDMSTTAYVLNSFDSAKLADLLVGMLKSAVFAWLVITIACQRGLAVEGGAEGVGVATTQSVAYSLLAVLVANAAITAIFFF